MDRVFSVEEISDPFWQSSQSSSNDNNNNNKKMNRSSSEWAFQRFLQEASISQNPPSQSLSSSTTTSPSLNEKPVEINDPPIPNHSLEENVPIDSEEYQKILKQRLDLACAAVALSRVFLRFRVLGFDSHLF